MYYSNRNTIKSVLGWLQILCISSLPLSMVFAQSASDFFSRGITDFENHKFETAADNLSKAIELKPNWEKAIFIKGKAKIELGLFNEALDCFVIVYNMNPTEAEYAYYRGRAEWKLNRINAAIEHLEKAIVYDPRHFEAYQTLGYINQELKFFDKAKIYYDLALQSHPAFNANAFNKSKVKNNISDYTEALDEYTKAILKDSNDVMAYLNRGLLKEISKDNKGAFNDFNKCIKIDRGFSIAYYYRGIASFNLNNLDESIKDFEEYIKVFPSDENAKIKLDQAKRKIKNN